MKSIPRKKLTYKKSTLGRIREVDTEAYNPATKLKVKEKFVRKGIAGKEQTMERQNLALHKSEVRKIKTGIGRPTEVEITKYGRKKKRKTVHKRHMKKTRKHRHKKK